MAWNYDNDAFLSIAKSTDSVLEDFFSMQSWEFIRHCFDDIYNEVDTEHEHKRIEFTPKFANIYVNDNKSQMQKHECLKAFITLCDLMMIGANDDHHSVRYEPWWQDFTQTLYLLRCKIEVQEQLLEGSVDV